MARGSPSARGRRRPRLRHELRRGPDARRGRRLEQLKAAVSGWCSPRYVTRRAEAPFPPGADKTARYPAILSGSNQGRGQAPTCTARPPTRTTGRRRRRPAASARQQRPDRTALRRDYVSGARPVRSWTSFSIEGRPQQQSRHSPHSNQLAPAPPRARGTAPSARRPASGRDRLGLALQRYASTSGPHSEAWCHQGSFPHSRGGAHQGAAVHGGRCTPAEGHAQPDPAAADPPGPRRAACRPGSGGARIPACAEEPGSSRTSPK